MEITREYFCWAILYGFKKGLTPQKCLVSLCETFGNEASLEKAVYNWPVEFYRIRATVNDEPHEE